MELTRPVPTALFYLHYSVYIIYMTGMSYSGFDLVPGDNVRSVSFSHLPFYSLHQDVSRRPPWGLESPWPGC
jgi:hypothetical protein